jgi:hypothetical protein
MVYSIHSKDKMKTKPRIFVSVPDDRHLDEDRKALKRAIIGFIAKQGFRVEGFETEQFGLGLPKKLKFWTFDNANDLIRRCDGALILALARTHVRVVQPRSNNRSQQSPISTVPTSYNHLEGTLAIARQLEVLIVLEEDMERSGIFQSGYKSTTIPPNAGQRWIKSDFRAHFDTFAEGVRKRRDIFLGYCSKANSSAREIRSYLEGQGFSVLDWSRDFKSAGPTILEEIERAASLCRCAIFLFTQDDELEKNAKAKASSEAVPRDNVLLEAGYFTQALGKERVAIVREAGTKMPADLGGIIYLLLENRKKLLPVKQGLIRFLKEVL